MRMGEKDVPHPVPGILLFLVFKLASCIWSSFLEKVKVPKVLYLDNHQYTYNTVCLLSALNIVHLNLLLKLIQ